MSCSALILTGGTSERIKEINYPKQFYEILGKPVFVHCLETYECLFEIDKIYLVINKNFYDTYKKILSRFCFSKLMPNIIGGNTREKSIEKGVNVILNSEFVVIQDGANPTTHPMLIRKCISEAKKNNACSAYVPARHTVFQHDKKRIQFVFNKSNLGYIVAPQVYRIDIIKKLLRYAHINNLNHHSLEELTTNLNIHVSLVESIYENIKITTYEHFKIVENILLKRRKDSHGPVKIGKTC